MKKLFLHIGAHKTGTTSLQSLFYRYRGQLRESGIVYPKSCFFQYAQHRLAFALKNMKDPAASQVPSFSAEIEELRSEVESFPDDYDYVMSSEEFLSLSSENVVALLEALGSIFSEIQILATLRRQDNQFISIYNQKVKSFGNKFFRHYTHFLNVPTMLDSELDYDRCLKNWSEALGDSTRIKLFVYEKEEHLSQTYFNYVCKTPVQVEDVRVNKSVSVVALEFVRNLKARSISDKKAERLGRKAYSFFKVEPNESMLTKDVRVNKSVSVVALEFVRNLKARSISDKKVERLGRKAYSFFKVEPNESMLTKSDRKVILDYFRDGNRNIEKRFGLTLDYDYETCESDFDELVVRRLNVNDVFAFFLNN